MYRVALPSLLIGFISITYADSATQTDWSGGPGISGPVTVWENSFQLYTDTDWSGSQGCLLLEVHTASYEIALSSYTIYSIHSADIDGDDDPDIIGATGRSIRFWENYGSNGTDWIEHEVDSSCIATSLSSADLDCDGYRDILGASEEENKIYWWQNPGRSGSRWTKHEICSFSESELVCTIDFDGDGDADVVGAGLFGIAWWENTEGSGLAWMYHSIAGAYGEARSLSTGDIDGDGDWDVIATSGDRITWWANMDGYGIDWLETTVEDRCGTARSACSIDPDGDGDQDILALSFSGDSVSWWENVDGSGSVWITHPIAIINSVRSVFPADIDCDGDIDVICGSWFPNTMSWWENSAGSGTDWERHGISDPPTRIAIPADVNCDGFTDVVGSVFGSGGNRVNWYNLHAYENSGLLRSSILSTEYNPDWDRIEWSADTPAGTSVTLQVRASDDCSMMGGWLEIQTSPCSLHTIIDDGDEYFQYMAILQTDDSSISPILLDVSVSWDSIGSVTSPPQAGVFPLSLYPLAPNPSAGTSAVRFSLPEHASVDISIFDLSGRLISEIQGDDYSPGYHDVLLGDLSPGVYFCRMISGDYSAMQRFAVIE